FSATSVTTEEHENEDTFSSASPTVTLSALDDGKGVISPKDAGPGDAEILKEDAKAVNAGEDNGIVIEDGTGAFDEREDEVVFDGDQTVLQDSEDNEAQDLAEGDNTGENEEEASINEQRGAASYYILGFEYTDTLQNQDFYSVNNFRPCEQDTGAQYIIDISSEKGALVPNITGRGVIVVRDECPEDLFIYDYDFGNGNYSFMSEKTALRFWQNNADIKPYHIRGAEIYYKINITNNEWFKRNILDRDAGEQCDKLPVEVYTRPASKVTAEDITSARFIAVMSGDAQYCIGDSFDNYSYGDNDLSVRSFRNILGLIVESRIPIIGDYRIVTDYETLSENSTTYVREPVASDLIKKLRLSHDDMYKCFNTLYSISDEFYDVNGLSVSSDAITLSGNDNHFVNENVYIYNRKLDNQSTGIYTCLLNDKLMRAFNSEEIKAGFADVLTDVETENLYRKAEKLKELDKTISEATAIRYIIGFRKKRAAGEHKGEMRILEIEPCASYDLSTESEEVDDNGNIVGSKLFVHGDRDNPLIDQDGAKIIVTQMTTAQFIGRIEDINVDYDMIYFGMNTDKMNTRSIETEDVTAGRATQEDYNAQVKMTDYNDLNMDGLVYSNVGDYAYMQIHLAGMLDNEYVSGTKGNGGVKSAMVIKTGNDRDVYKTRYGGNDITQEKVNALKDFVNAGFPIVMDDSFFIRNTDQTYSINKCKVDTASYMYSFIESVMNEDNVFKLSNLSPGLFDFYLNLSKPKLTMYGNAAASMTTTQNVYKDTEDGYFYVPFNFSIDNKGAVSATDDYYVNLYIDVNADGKYSATQESVDFTRLVNSDSGEVISKTGGTYAVRPGVTYYGTYRLSGSQAGVIPWRIVVKQSGNTLRRANATGYYQMSNTKPEIKVLQINSVDVESVDNGRGSNEGNASYLERSNLKHGDNYEVSLRRDGWIQKIEGVYHSTWNMQQEYEAGSGNKFYDLLTDNCVPYDIKITTVTSTEFSAMSPTYSARVRARYRINDAQVRTLNTTRRNQMSVEINGYDEELRNSIKQEYSDAIAAYDMVIMGFGDCYVAPNMIAVEAIKDFVNSGHSILFTHDCTSMMSTLVDENGYSSGTVYNGIRLLDTYSANTGYECNEKLRNLVGMDRYNVLNEAKDGTYVHDSIYKPRTSRTDSNKITSSQIHGFTYGNINTSGYFGTQYKDVYEKASPNKNVTEPLANLKDIDHTHDDYGWIDNYRNPENGSDVDPNCDSYDKRHHIHTVGQYYDMSVKKVNGGQITEYPYKLPDKFPVANTHEQWFQLDVTADDDFDGESDIVVWYCLDDSGLVDDEAKNGKPADMYAMSPGDVRNNYYIYNKGNVTYSGVGHSDVMKGDSENEMKLFINTIVAAYRSGLHAPDITFKEGYAGKRNTDNIYITYDEQLDISQHADQGEIIGVTKDVYFMPEQVSLVQNAEFVSHTMSAKFYYEVPAGTTGATTIRYNTNEYTVKELPVDTTSVTYMDPETGAILEGDLNNLKNGAVHKVSFAMDAMGAFMGSGSNLKNTINLFVVATDSVTNSKTGVNSTMTSTAAANIVRTEVFDLD
ncbi:MAG: DUF5057 domain-containing protein, partial [Lachnospiraceae bacterium]|nr:DUF5057 domain-containing protein [Lachnospiraceae bacterium]